MAVVGPAFLDIPITMIVGNRDTRIDASMRQEPAITDHQGLNRLRRAHSFSRAMAERAASEGRPNRSHLMTLRGTSHDFTQCVVEDDLLGIVGEALLRASYQLSTPIGD